MADYALQRKNMVESQVRPSDVTDRRIIRAMLDIAREAFLPASARATAYMDGNLPLPQGRGGQRYILEPRLHARLMQLLEIDAGNLVLDIAGGPGYSAAILARLAQTVVALEADPQLAEAATAALTAVGADNVAVIVGPHASGLAAEGPYDAILVNGAVSDVSPALLDQLKDGGRLVAVVSRGAVGKATVWRRLGGTFDRREAFEAAAPVVPGFEAKPAFVF